MNLLNKILAKCNGYVMLGIAMFAVAIVCFVVYMISAYAAVKT